MILRLKEIRKSKKVTQIELANSINSSQRMVWAYESGKVDPTLSKLVDIAKALDVTLDELVDFKEKHTEYSERLSSELKKHKTK